MFTRTDRLLQHLCLRIDGCSRELKKRSGKICISEICRCICFNDDAALTMILGRGEIARATLRELCIFDESESLSLSLLLLLLTARVFESIVFNY